MAGGIGENVHIGDVVIATACVEYDFDTSALDQWPAGQLTLPGYEEPMRFLPCGQTLAHILSRAAEGLYGRAHLGIVATGDKFVADPRFGDYLQKEFGALACEMEGGAIAHACLVNKIPCARQRNRGLCHLRQELGGKGPAAAAGCAAPAVRCPHEAV